MKKKFTNEIEKSENLLAQSLKSYADFIKNGTENVDKFIDIDDIEEKLADLLNTTRNTCINFSDNLLNEIDEKKLISLKKRIYIARNKSEKPEDFKKNITNNLW